MNTTNIIGFESEKNLQKDLSDIDILFHPKMAIPRKIVVTCGKFVQVVVKSLGKQNVQRAFRVHKENCINFLDEFSDVISFQDFAEILKLSTKTLYNWKHQVKFKCDHSALLYCVKRHPNQASVSEVSVVNEWLTKAEFQHWGIHSIWATPFQTGLTNLSKQAWYHYTKIIGCRNNHKMGSKPKNATPIRAERINQIWHADITVFKTLDGVKHYIYTVMDNNSRYIHSWRIESVVSAKIRLETIQEAISKAFLEKNYQNLQLITDRGPENDNLTIKAFMSKNSTSIKHDIALRDIVQSNSMMEAFYRTTKYVSLYNQKLENYNQLLKAFQNWIVEYHTLKPHYNLGIYTPLQILQGADKNEKFSQRMIDAAIQRREINKNVNCSQKCQ
jgi:putative transposase